MKTIRAFCLFGIAIVLAQTAVTQIPTPDGPPSLTVIRNRLAAITGPGAVTCREGLHDRSNAASECALRSFQQGKPFSVEFDMQGFDSVGAGALARDPTGKMFLLMFDGDGWSNDDLRNSRKGAKLIDNNKVIIEQCPVEAELYKTKSGRLTCFAPGPDSSDPW